MIHAPVGVRITRKPLRGFHQVNRMHRSGTRRYTPAKLAGAPSKNLDKVNLKF